MTSFVDIHANERGTSAPVPGPVLPFWLDHNSPWELHPRNHVESLQELQLGDRTLRVLGIFSDQVVPSWREQCSKFPIVSNRLGMIGYYNPPINHQPTGVQQPLLHMVLMSNEPMGQDLSPWTLQQLGLMTCQGDMIKTGLSCAVFFEDGHQSIKDISQDHQIHNMPTTRTPIIFF